MAAWYLGALYARLDEAVRNVARSMGRYDMVSYVNANFLQLFLWERFKCFAPEPGIFKAPQSQLVDGVEKVKASHLASRARRWYGQPLVEKIPLIHLIDEMGTYNFRPYSFAPPGILPITLYSSEVSWPRSLKERSTLPGELKTLLAVFTPTMLPLNTENGEALSTYSPPRLMRQFGLDQGAVVVLGGFYISIWEAEGHYTNTRRDALLADLNSIF